MKKGKLIPEGIFFTAIIVEGKYNSAVKDGEKWKKATKPEKKHCN